MVVYDRNHLFGLGSETETENWPKLSADTETNRNHKNLKLESVKSKGLQKNFMSCQLLKHLFSIPLKVPSQSVTKQLEIISNDHFQQLSEVNFLISFRILNICIILRV